MPLLRFIDPDGREQDVADVNQLYELVKAGKVNYESLVRDEKSGLWVHARDHEFFVRVRKLAGQAPEARHPLSSDTHRQGGFKETQTIQHASNELHVRLLARGHAHLFLVVCVWVYVVAVIACFIAIRLGHGGGRRALVILLATPIFLPIALRLFIPTTLMLWRQLGSPLVPSAELRGALTRNGGFIVGAALLVIVMMATVVALGP